jgi:hypothetical protein
MSRHFAVGKKVLTIHYVHCTGTLPGPSCSGARRTHLQSTQSAGPVRFFIFCSISLFLLASLVPGMTPQCTACAD